MKTLYAATIVAILMSMLMASAMMLLPSLISVVLGLVGFVRILFINDRVQFPELYEE